MTCHVDKTTISNVDTSSGLCGFHKSLLFCSFYFPLSLYNPYNLVPKYYSQYYPNAKSQANFLLKDCPRSVLLLTLNPKP